MNYIAKNISYSLRCQIIKQIVDIVIQIAVRIFNLIIRKIINYFQEDFSYILVPSFSLSS